MAEIVSCLLDRDNGRVVGGRSIAGRVIAQAKEHLWDERSGAPVDTIVIHYISACEFEPACAFDVDAVLSVFCEFGVSSHYLVDRDGGILRLVPENNKAWHCGGSLMPAPDNRRAVNEFSIGIELVATATSGFTDRQYESLAWLCLDIERRRGPMKYVGHEHIAGAEAVAMGLRKEPKNDPGPLFAWTRLPPGSAVVFRAPGASGKAA